MEAIDASTRDQSESKLPASAVGSKRANARSGASSILVVDDEREMCEVLDADLTRRGYAVTWYTSAGEALAALDSDDFGVMLVDINMDELGGLDLCRAAISKRPDLVVMVMTGFGSMEHAIGAMRAGAYDFITKPISMDVLALTLDRALRERSLQDELKRLRRRVATTELPNIVSGSPAMTRIAEIVNSVANSEASVLITGESGTGKELVARALHDRSGRKGPFLAVNCAAIPENLLESELFGHTRGAFTDARTDRAGLFTESSGGTLLLDEIGEMPLAMQPKILRALQERKVRPVGSSREVAFDSRVITATNRDLEEEVAKKRFREDLYYRINVVRIDMPPLRARGNEVLVLAQHFFEKSAHRNGTTPLRIGREVAECFVKYPWPGNVRELENCVERMIAVARYDETTVDDLPAKIREYRPDDLTMVSEDPNDLPSLATMEARYIRKVLAAAGGNRTLAAKILKVDRRTLYRKLDELAETSAELAQGDRGKD